MPRKNVRHLPLERTKPWKVSYWGKVVFFGTERECRNYRETNKNKYKSHLVVERNT